MEAALHRLVWERAAARCEYCRLPQNASDLTFHVEHVIARQHGGVTADENLALACDRCNLYKGTNLSGIDPQTSDVVRLFHPRRDAWSANFELCGEFIVGITAEGRATERLLRMNVAARRKLRAELLELGEF